MPNWTDDEGYNWYGMLECQRCLGRFKSDSRGEVSVHECLDGELYTSETIAGAHHTPKKVTKNER